MEIITSQGSFNYYIRGPILSDKIFIIASYERLSNQNISYLSYDAKQNSYSFSNKHPSTFRASLKPRSQNISIQDTQTSKYVGADGKASSGRISLQTATEVVKPVNLLKLKRSVPMNPKTILNDSNFPISEPGVTTFNNFTTQEPSLPENPIVSTTRPWKVSPLLAGVVYKLQRREKTVEFPRTLENLDNVFTQSSIRFIPLELYGQNCNMRRYSIQEIMNLENTWFSSPAKNPTLFTRSIDCENGVNFRYCTTARQCGNKCQGPCNDPDEICVYNPMTGGFGCTPIDNFYEKYPFWLLIFTVLFLGIILFSLMINEDRKFI